MNIKNYTSSVEASKSMARIEELLVEIGATNINKQYENKICAGITFLLYDQQLQQTLPFHLKAQTEECFWSFGKMLNVPALIPKQHCRPRQIKQHGKSSAIGPKSNAA